MVTQLQPDVRAYLHGAEVIKRYIKKKGRKAEPETVTADSAVKKQEEIEAMKKKTRNMLLGLVAVIVAAVAGIAAYKAMH